MKAMVRASAGFEEAALAALRLHAIDRALADLVLSCDCLTLAAKGHLADMQRKVRGLRIQIEVDARLPDLGRGSRVLPTKPSSAGYSHPVIETHLNVPQSLNLSKNAHKLNDGSGSGAAGQKGRKRC